MVTTAWVMMMLGDYPFSLSTAAYQALSLTIEHRWAEGARIGRRPAQQYLGPGPRRIELSGVIHPHFRGGLGQIDAMRAEAGLGLPRILVDGNGLVWGKFVILSVRERRGVFFADGSPRVQEFDLALSEYGDDA